MTPATISDAARISPLHGCIRSIPEFSTSFVAGGTNFRSEIFGTTNDEAYDVAGKMGIPLVSRLPAEYGPPTISNQWP